MLTDAHFREYMRLLRRCRPWTRARPPWFLFQMWLRRRPLNHEFLVSPIADYLLSVGVRDTALPMISWPEWVHEFVRWLPSWQDEDQYVNVRDCLNALDAMRGWTPKMNLQHGRQ